MIWLLIALLIAFIIYYRAVIYRLSLDPVFQCLTKAAGLKRYRTLRGFSHLVYLDIANMHGLNHKYNSTRADGFIKSVIDNVRSRDVVIRWGGDEFVFLVNTTDISTFCNKLGALLHQNNLYAVITHSQVRNGEQLLSIVEQTDDVCMQIKRHLEKTGQKPGRNDDYVMMDNIIAQV